MIECVTLEKLRQGLMMRFSQEYLDFCADLNYEPIYKMIEVSIRKSIMAEEKPVEEKVIEYPRDWWQHFKKDCFPKWLLKKYPVKTRKHTLKVRAVYPDFKPALRSQKVAFMQEEGYSGDYDL